MLKRLLSIALGISVCIGCAACGTAPNEAREEPVDAAPVEPAPSDGWSCIFAAAAQPSQIDVLPKNTHLSGSTCRQEFRASMAGSKIRLTFSNEHSATLDAPGQNLVIESVHVAKLLKAGEPDIDTSTDVAVTFSGEPGVTVAPGETVTSDGIDFSFDSLEYIAVTAKFGEVPSYPTCHQEADCGSWVVDGDRVSENFSPTEWMWSYFTFCRADGYSEGSESLVCFGDSITDGSISTWNGFDAWPDVLADGLQADPATSKISVVNTGIGGNSIWGGSGTPAKDRFERDVLGVAGVRYAVILIGTNDIPGAQEDISEKMIEEYSAMIDACHKRGIKIFAGTITPFGSNQNWASGLHEDIRTKVNSWMMSDESGFDGYIDFAAAVCDPADPTRLKAEFDSGDGLHPSAQGHRAMGEAAAAKIGEMVR